MTNANTDSVARALYLDLMKRSLMNLIYEGDTDMNIDAAQYQESNIDHKLHLTKGAPVDKKKQLLGTIWPSMAHTMIGIVRLNNIQYCVETVIKNKVPGDLIETGVWRGGATIFMRAILKAYEEHNRKVWVADSFEGLPPTSESEYEEDRDLDWLSRIEPLAVTEKHVRENFSRYDLLDEQVIFLKGWFRDTLPAVPIEKLSILRMDGDLYESTMDALTNLYPKLSVGGYAIVDDYFLPQCRKAIHDYRNSNGITDEIIPIDTQSVFWQRR